MSDDNELPDEFMLLMEKTQKHLKKHPNMSVADFFNNFLSEAFRIIHDDVVSLAEAVDETTDDLEPAFLDEAKTVMIALGAFVDQVLLKAGWIDEKGYTATFPGELKTQFDAIAGRLKAFNERIDEALEAYDDVDDEDEDDEEAEDASLVTANHQAQA